MENEQRYFLCDRCKNKKEYVKDKTTGRQNVDCKRVEWLVYFYGTSVVRKNCLYFDHTGKI